MIAASVRQSNNPRPASIAHPARLTGACRRGPFLRCSMNDIQPGMKVGRWTILEELPKDSHYRRKFKCRCECGLEKVVRGDGLQRPGNIGCYGCAKRTHAMIHTPEYATWSAMKNRCSNPDDEHWTRYGGRGISVCERWRESFEAFLEDMGPRPAGKTLDRYPNPDGNYEPSNCRWATPTEQQNNRRDNLRIEIEGTTRTAVEWSRISGIDSNVICSRFVRRNRNGLTTRECVFTPLQRNRKERANEY